jgi:hypothetical protein
MNNDKSISTGVVRGGKGGLFFTGTRGGPVGPQEGLGRAESGPQGGRGALKGPQGGCLGGGNI